jgi:integrase
MKLTDTMAATLEPPPGKIEHFEWDDSLPGFGIRLRKLGAEISRRWYLQYRVGRQQRRESLGDVRKIKLDAARKIARQRFAQVELGADPAADRARIQAEAAAVKLTIGTVADRYLKAKKDSLRPSTYEAAARYFELHWKPLRTMPISAVKRADIAAALQEITAVHGKVASARARSNLSALFSWAMREGLCEANSVIATNIPDADIKPRERVLDDHEIREIWHACQDDDFGRIVRLLILCGCRRGEIGDLKWSEIDLDTGIMTISGERIKNGRILTLTLASAAIEILRSAPRRGEYVFGKRGRAGFNAWSYCTIALNNRIATATGRPLAGWILHDLRRTARTGLGRIGVPPHIAELVIGHAKGGIEAIYDRHKYGAEIKTALARWADHVANVIEGRQSNVVPLRVESALSTVVLKTNE